MTIPTLVSSYKKKEYSTRLKKFFSTMKQVMQLSQIKNGSTVSWDYNSNLDTWWNIYFAPYIKTSKTEKSGSNLIVYFQDGTSLTFTRGAATEFLYDVNGDNPPNTRGYDQLAFLMRKMNTAGGNAGSFTPYDWNADIDEINDEYNPNDDDIKFTTDFLDRNNVLRLCEKVGSFCSQLLFLDNWEYKEDYPRKF